MLEYVINVKQNFSTKKSFNKIIIDPLKKLYRHLLYTMTALSALKNEACPAVVK